MIEQFRENIILSKNNEKNKSELKMSAYLEKRFNNCKELFQKTLIDREERERFDENFDLIWGEIVLKPEKIYNGSEKENLEGLEVYKKEIIELLKEYYGHLSDQKQDEFREWLKTNKNIEIIDNMIK